MKANQKRQTKEFDPFTANNQYSVRVYNEALSLLLPNLPQNLIPTMVAKKEKSKKSKNEEEEEVDYAAVADQFADLSDQDSVEDGDDNGENNESATGDNADSIDESENSGSDDEGDEEDDDDHEEGDVAGKIPTNSFAGTEPCSFDMHNLLAINSHQMDTSKMYIKKAGKYNDEEDITIPPESLEVAVNEKYLLEKAASGCTQLIAALWQLPIESSDIGPMVSLPIHDGSKIPRQLVRLSSLSQCTFLLILDLPFLTALCFITTVSPTSQERNKMGKVC